MPSHPLLDICVDTPEIISDFSKLVPSFDEMGWIGVQQISDGANLYESRRRSFEASNAHWVSIGKPNETFVQLSQFKRTLETTTQSAIFSNSLLIENGKRSLRHPRNFVWDGTSTLLSGIIPRFPYFVKREVAIVALQSAYERILKDRPELLEFVDLVFVYEIQMLCGWQYDSRIFYQRSSVDRIASVEKEELQLDIMGFYKKLMS